MTGDRRSAAQLRAAAAGRALGARALAAAATRLLDDAGEDDPLSGLPGVAARLTQALNLVNEARELDALADEKDDEEGML